MGGFLVLFFILFLIFLFIKFSEQSGNNYGIGGGSNDWWDDHDGDSDFDSCSDSDGGDSDGGD